MCLRHWVARAVLSFTQRERGLPSQQQQQQKLLPHFSQLFSGGDDKLRFKFFSFLLFFPPFFSFTVAAAAD